MNDKVFGELVFNNGWEKKLDCDFWGQESVKIRVSAYKDEEPNDNQRDAYSRFKEDIKQISRWKNIYKLFLMILSHIWILIRCRMI